MLLALWQLNLNCEQVGDVRDLSSRFLYRTGDCELKIPCLGQAAQNNGTKQLLSVRKRFVTRHVRITRFDQHSADILVLLLD